jgi:hypothetical protein
MGDHSGRIAGCSKVYGQQGHQTQHPEIALHGMPKVGEVDIMLEHISEIQVLLHHLQDVARAYHSTESIPAGEGTRS